MKINGRNAKRHKKHHQNLRYRQSARRVAQKSAQALRQSDKTTCFIIFNDYVTILVLSTAVREDSSVFFAFRPTDIAKKKSHGKPRVPTVGNVKLSA